MTERIYYTEPTKTTFEALVVAVESSGSQSVVELDKTAFYPSSGGQPHDTGVLGGARVVDVRGRSAAAAVWPFRAAQWSGVCWSLTPMDQVIASWGCGHTSDAGNI